MALVLITVSGVHEGLGVDALRQGGATAYSSCRLLERTQVHGCSVATKQEAAAKGLTDVGLVLLTHYTSLFI